MNERAKARKKNKTEQARERKRETERGGGGTDQRIGKNTLKNQGMRKVFKEGKNPSSSEEGREKQGLWRRGNKEEDWERSCGNTGGPRPASSAEGMGRLTHCEGRSRDVGGGFQVSG